MELNEPVTHERFNVRKHTVFAAVAFIVNIALVFASYRILIFNSGLETVGLWSIPVAWVTLLRLGDVGMGTATFRFVALGRRSGQCSDIF